jgi:rhomboid protease GluP
LSKSPLGIEAIRLSEQVEDDVWVEVGRFRLIAEAEQHALVLVALGMASRLVSSATGTSLFVASPDAAKARSEIAAYDQENTPRPTTGWASRPLREGINGALIFCAILLFVDAAAGRNAFSYDWLALGNAQAGLIKHGEWWRVITALSLHADGAHLLSNMVLGGVLGMVLAQLLGSGLAWLAILMSGAVGNAVTAFFASAEHAAIGASTAVFGALGLLAALAWGREPILWRGLRRWRPIAAAIMLLALLGVGGERTDVGAHVAGLLTGGVSGAALYFAYPHLPKGRKAQLVFGSAALALFTGAWLAAFAAA